MNGIWFGNKHSYNDFGLILKSKNIPFPDPKTDTVEIQGADGILDLSTALTDGDVKYKNRKCQFVFTVIDPSKNWETVKSKFANYLHGQIMNVKLDIDSGFYYVGRCSLGAFAAEKRTATITVTVNADPYKYDVLSSDEAWKWDSFNLENGIIYSLSNIEVETTKTIVIPSRRMHVVPTINVSAAMDAVFNGSTYGLVMGDNINLNIMFTEGENTITFNGTGTVSIKFRGGSL